MRVGSFNSSLLVTGQRRTGRLGRHLVRHLYSVGSNAAATLILFFSIIVPFTKSLLVTWAVTQSRPERRRRMLFLVEVIAKWSMADVFAVAVIIAYLAAQASQGSSAIVVFEASFGPGFYWFASYCLASLFVQQLSARWIVKALDRAQAA